MTLRIPVGFVLTHTVGTPGILNLVVLEYYHIVQYLGTAVPRYPGSRLQLFQSCSSPCAIYKRVLRSRFKLALTNATNRQGKFWHRVRGGILECEA